MADYLNITVEEFRKQYARQKFGKWTLDEVKRKGKYDCIFLRWDDQGKSLCSVYPVRPHQCKTWPFWPENLTSARDWADAARTCPGMARNDGTFVPAESIRVIRDSHD